LEDRAIRLRRARESLGMEQIFLEIIFGQFSREFAADLSRIGYVRAANIELMDWRNS
jgi:hypothetical protein